MDGSATADQQTDDETESGGYADGTPGIVMHVIVGDATDLLGLVHHGRLGFGQLDLGRGEAVGGDFARRFPAAACAYQRAR